MIDALSLTYISFLTVIKDSSDFFSLEAPEKDNGLKYVLHKANYESLYFSLYSQFDKIFYIKQQKLLLFALQETPNNNTMRHLMAYSGILIINAPNIYS